MPDPIMTAGKSFAIPIGFLDVGDYPVESTASSLACISIKPDEINTAFSRVRKTFTFSSHGGTLPPHTDSGSYQTTSCPVVTDDTFKQFWAGKILFCGFGAVEWKDGTGSYETDFGQCLEAEPDGKSWNWHNLPQTNKETKLR
jgi:hypothetical protein